ncbi:MAG: DUF6873 family GME fold protein [Filifactoraceae bacterium]
MNFNISEAQGMIVDYRVDESTRRFLETLDKEIFYTFESKRTMKAVNGHPDMLACAINKITVVDMKFLELYKERLSDYNVISGESKLAPNYPYDIAYNVAIVGNFAIGKIKHIDKILLDEIKKADYTIVDVNQGYAKCSIAIVDEKSVLTSDRSIIKACNEILNVGVVENDEGIVLDNMYGFIGGASFTLGKRLIFFGDYKTHRDKNFIKKFCEERGVEPISIGNGRLKDYGGIVPLYKK